MFPFYHVRILFIPKKYVHILFIILSRTDGWASVRTKTGDWVEMPQSNIMCGSCTQVAYMQKSIPAAWPCALFLLPPLLICLFRFCATLSLSLTIAYAGATALLLPHVKLSPSLALSLSLFMIINVKQIHRKWKLLCCNTTLNNQPHQKWKRKTKQRAKPIAFFF